MAKIISSENIYMNDNDNENLKTVTVSKIFKEYKPGNIFNAYIHMDIHNVR